MKGRSGCGPRINGASQSPPGNSIFTAYWFARVAFACLAFQTLVFISGVHRAPLAFLSNLDGRTPSSQSPPTEENARQDADFAPPADAGDRLLGGLLAAGGFDAESCLSRYESFQYRKASPWRPSPYLVQKLREYEARHRRCGPHTEAYNFTENLLKFGDVDVTGSPSTECKYVVYIPRDGLGNRLLSISSAFLYTLLTGRVLLIDRSKDMGELFCEPFPETSWLLPAGFPLDNIYELWTTKNFYSNLMKRNISSKSGGSGGVPAYFYVHLAHEYDDVNRLFLCESGGSPVQKIPWMFVMPNQYFIPALFLNPAFEQELLRMFPERHVVFHHLGRYLFHPTNAVWGLITRYYRAYLAAADQTIGIQIRVFDNYTSPAVLLRNILNCTMASNLLPELVNVSQSFSSGDAIWKRKAVLVASLNSGYVERIKDLYWEYPTADGVAVSVHQPSHDELQQTEEWSHDKKALAEIYLLSFSDAVVTTAYSTFGYVAHGLGGLRPWILFPHATETEQACARAPSTEPCLHVPPGYDCRARRRADTGNMVPYIRPCLDHSAGIQLVDPSLL